MLQITLIRHGIAEDKKIWQSDFDRALTSQWRKKLLKHLEKHHESLCSIDTIICSPSLRTRQTCALLCSVIDIIWEKIIYDKNLYMFENNYQILLHTIAQYNKNMTHICLVGHDYGISDLAMHFSPGNERMKNWEIRTFSIKSL